MQILKQKILQSGKIYPNNVLKVDSFLNHQVDVALLAELSKELFRLYKDSGVTKILTIETSGIMLACLTAQVFNVPMLYAKKTKTSNMSEDVFTAQVFSYTHYKEYTIYVSKEYLSSSDKVLLIDDFLANGFSMKGLVQLAQSAGATVVGAGVAIEKGFQGGGDILRSLGLRIEAMAIIDSMTEEGIIFRE
ncbi:MAG: xanthine phosphoribosyltransferase [Clostridia bacterium]|nr:xanthine phosphoribosyltransferase [Clostridia bacterium]